MIKSRLPMKGKTCAAKKSDTEVVLETKEFIFGPHGSIRGSKMICTTCWIRS